MAHQGHLRGWLLHLGSWHSRSRPQLSKSFISWPYCTLPSVHFTIPWPNKLQFHWLPFVSQRWGICTQFGAFVLAVPPPEIFDPLIILFRSDYKCHLFKRPSLPTQSEEVVYAHSVPEPNFNSLQNTYHCPLFSASGSVLNSLQNNLQPT